MMQAILPYVTFAMISAQMFGNSTRTTQVLGQESMSLADRYPVTSVNSVFKDNILLSTAYLRNAQEHSKPVNWTDIESPFTYSFTLAPGEVFAFHKDVLPQFEGKVVKTMDTDFGLSDGYKSDGYLVGDGVCHMATLLNWVASESGLLVVAPTPHDFAVIPDIPKKYGTAIYFDPATPVVNAKQNLYIQNTKTIPVTFVISYENDNLRVEVSQDK